MTRTLPSLARLALPLSGAVFTSAMGVAAYTAYRINQPRPRTWRDEFTFSPFEAGVPHENVSFVTDDGLTIRGWFLPRHETERVVICCTGHRGAKPDLLGIGSGLWRAGNNVLLFDFRGCGESDSAPISLAHREVMDARAAVRFIAERVPGAQKAMVGFSMGGAVSILVAAADPSIRAIVTDSAFMGMREVVAHNLRKHRLPSPVVPLTDVVNRWRYGYPFAAVRPVDLIDRIAPRPIFIIHGDADALVPVSHARQLFERAGEPKRLWILPGVRHCGAYFADRATYVQRVSEFLDAAFSHPPSIHSVAAVSPG